jgi:hypothetical protein
MARESRRALRRQPCAIAGLTRTSPPRDELRGMVEPSDPARLLTALTTEHFTLQGARGDDGRERVPLVAVPRLGVERARGARLPGLGLGRARRSASTSPPAR